MTASGTARRAIPPGAAEDGGLVVAFVLAASIIFSGVQPQLAAIGERVYLVFGQGDVISVARSSDGGDTFDTPSPLPGAGKLALGMRRGPRIAVTRDAVLVAAVAGIKGGGADGDVLLYRSTDGGTTWRAPVAINDVPGSPGGVARTHRHPRWSRRGGLT